MATTQNPELSGLELAAYKKQKLIMEVQLLAQFGIVPRLAIIHVPHDDQSEKYIRLKALQGAAVGIQVDVVEVEPDLLKILAAIDVRNRDDSVHGIIVQLPLPGKLHDHDLTSRVLNEISPSKDADALGRPQAYREPSRSVYRTAGAAAVMDLLAAHKVSLRGKLVAVIGQGRTMGAPLVPLLRESGATVRVYYLPDKPVVVKEVRQCAVIVAATNTLKPVVLPEMVKDGAVVIDATGSQVDEAVRANPKVRTSPAVGGVGPLTVVNLLGNVAQQTISANWTNQRLNRELTELPQ